MPEQPCLIFDNGDLILGGKYRVERCLGRGGFAEVYLVTHVALNAPRAIKVLHRKAPGVGSTQMHLYRERFTLEAQLGARINHPHVVRVYDFVEEEGEALYLIMEYMPGGSLYDRLEAVREGKRSSLSVEEVVRLGIDVAKGLAALHERQIVHRDLKPSNILFDAEGRAKVADLGLAQIPGGPSMRSQLSEPVPHPGTPAYMSPEQMDTYGYLTPASDVYTLGAVLFEALTGKVYRGVRPGTRPRELRKDVPRWLDDLIARMLAEDPQERPWDGVEVARALEKRHKGKHEPAATGAPVAVSRTLWWGVGALVALLLLVGLLWAVLGRGPNGRERPTPTPVAAIVPSVHTPTRASASLIVSPVQTPTNTWTPVPTNTAASPPPPHTPTPTITWTPTPTWTSMPTPTPTLTPKTVGRETSLSLSVLPILAENAAHVTQLIYLGIGWISEIAYSPDGRLLAVGTSVGVYLYDVATLAEVRFLKTRAAVASVSFSPHGDLLASGLADGTVRLWSVADERLLRTFKGHTGWVWSVAFSPDGDLLATGSADKTVCLWRVADGTLLRTLNEHEGPVWSVDFSPDSTLLASGAGDDAVRLWRVQDGRLLDTFKEHTSDVRSVAFSPDGDLLATGSADGTVRLWQVADGALLRTLDEHEGPVWSVAFSPDGVLLATGSWDKTVRLWHVYYGVPLRTLRGHAGYVLSVAFSPDGTLLASGSGDGTVRLWGVPGQ